MGKGQHGGGEAKKKGEPGYVAPPDGGWGWVVVLSSFMIHVITDGIVYSFGVFLAYFVNHFGSGRGATSWVGSLQPAVTFTVGPLASVLTNRYGCRAVTIAGSFICASGFILSIFMPNLYFLYLTSGIMAGLGFGLIYLPAIVSVAQYFEKRRSFAIGVAVCGSGCGTFVMAPIIEILLEEYSWRGTMLILGGVILNVVVCGSVLRPLEGAPEVEEEDSEKNEEDEAKQVLNTVPENEALLEEKVNSDALNDKPCGNNHDLVIKVTQVGSDGVEALDYGGGGGGEDVSEPLNARKQVAWLSNSINDLAPPPTDHDDHNSINIAKIAKSDGALHRLRKQSPQRPRSFSRQHSITTTTRRPLGRKDVFYTGSLQNIPMYRSHRDLYITSITSLNIKQAEVAVETRPAKCCGIPIPSDFREAFREMMDFSLLKNPVFLMFAISNFFTSIGFNVPFNFLPDRAKLVGIDDKRAAWLLSVIGIANTVGRVVFGFIADLKWVNRLMLYNTALTICGVATALSPFVGGSYELLITYAAVFGIFIGVYVSLTSIVLVDLLGIDVLTNSFGLLLLFQGAATFIGSPMAGWMYDWTKSYNITFAVMGTLIAISGAMLYLLPFVQRRYRRNMLPEKREHQKVMGVRSTDSSSSDEEITLQASRKTSL